jgi:hypothetical protein
MRLASQILLTLAVVVIASLTLSQCLRLVTLLPY